MQGTPTGQFAASATPAVAIEKLAAAFTLVLHPVTDTMLPSVGKHAICNAMTRIITTAYRYKPPPRKRKAVAALETAIVHKRGRNEVEIGRAHV